MRELWWMASGAWQQTALLASIAAMPEEGAEPFTPQDFNPFLAGMSKKSSKPELLPYDAEFLASL